MFEYWILRNIWYDFFNCSKLTKLISYGSKKNHNKYNIIFNIQTLTSSDETHITSVRHLWFLKLKIVFTSYFILIFSNTALVLVYLVKKKGVVHFLQYSRVWNRRSPLLKKFQIRILIHFYIIQGIAVIFQCFFFLIFFSKIDKRTSTFIPVPDS